MNYNLNFSIEDMRVIDEALGNMPYKIAAPVIAHINEQIANKNNDNENEKE